MDKDELMTDMWNHWEPYNEGGNGKWRSYIISRDQADLLEASGTCVTLTNSEQGIYVS